MQQCEKRADTRRRNKYFDALHISTYFTQYLNKLKVTLEEVDRKALEEAIYVMDISHRIFVCGNGGSASIADHLQCDFQKGTFISSEKPRQIISLSAHTATLTAIANDDSYDNVFSSQLDFFGCSEDDLLICVSSSGNSKNILNACTFAHGRSTTVIGLSGFDGGRLKREADISLHVPADNYGIIEDAHQALMHCLAQYFYLKHI
jgi:D-sedoheptulose 7-phosphate isomerase